MADVQVVADRVRLLQVHQPITVGILSSSESDGTDYRQLGMLSADGDYLGLAPPRTVCSAHDDLQDWPCPEVRALAEHYAAPVVASQAGPPAEPPVEPAAEPTAEPAAEPAAERVAEPAAELAS